LKRYGYYLNHVGYKDALENKGFWNNMGYYLNHVGYKEQGVGQPTQKKKRQVLSEPCGI